jgi:hypothetical protein
MAIRAAPRRHCRDLGLAAASGYPTRGSSAPDGNLGGRHLGGRPAVSLGRDDYGCWLQLLAELRAAHELSDARLSDELAALDQHVTPEQNHLR